jgi:hypothetical protein
MVGGGSQYEDGCWFLQTCQIIIATGLEDFRGRLMEIKGDDGNPSCLPAWEAVGMTEGFGHCLIGVWCQSDDL